MRLEIKKAFDVQIWQDILENYSNNFEQLIKGIHEMSSKNKFRENQKREVENQEDNFYEEDEEEENKNVISEIPEYDNKENLLDEDKEPIACNTQIDDIEHRQVIDDDDPFSKFDRDFEEKNQKEIAKEFKKDDKNQEGNDVEYLYKDNPNNGQLM